MSISEVVIEGTLKADGTLDLDKKPNLAPGRVTVVLRQEIKPATEEGWWPYMQRVRGEREMAGYHFMNETEMEAHIMWLREDDDRIDQELDLAIRREEKR